MLSASSRIHRAAPSLQTLPDKPMVATKSAILTMVRCRMSASKPPETQRLRCGDGSSQMPRMPCEWPSSVCVTRFDARLQTFSQGEGEGEGWGWS